jgi:hypothetical protein
MKRNPAISAAWLYPPLIFAAGCLLPWWDSKSGDKLPLGTAYVNDFPGWKQLLCLHVLAAVALSIPLMILHRRLTSATKK